MTEATQQQPAAPPAPPANATEASARLGALTADKAWSDKLLAGDVAATKEFHSLTEMVATGGDDVDRALAGASALPDMPSSEQRMMTGTVEMLREIGVEDGAIRQTLEGYEVSQAEFDAVKAWQARTMKDSFFVKAYLDGDPDAARQMMLANIVLSSSVKKSEAA